MRFKVQGLRFKCGSGHGNHDLSLFWVWLRSSAAGFGAYSGPPGVWLLF